MSSDNGKTIKLKHPIILEGRDPIVEIRFGRMKLKHLKLIPDSFFNSESKKITVSKLIPAIPAIVSGLAGIPEEVAEEIDVADVEQVAEVLADFFEATQA